MALNKLQKVREGFANGRSITISDAEVLPLALDVAVDIALEAGALLRDSLAEEKEISFKRSAIDLVTQFDKAAEELIIGRLLTAFPDHTLVGEEGGTRGANSKYQWHIDPIDGTINFAHGLPVFGVSIGLYEYAKPLVGVIYDPMRDECFCAAAGQGSFVRRDGKNRPLQVSAASSLMHSLVATGFAPNGRARDRQNLRPFGRILEQVQGIRRSGSAAIDLAYVAAGRLDGYWQYDLNSWDVAAGMLLVREAGGMVTGLAGEPAVLQPQLDLVVSNGRIHSQLLSLLTVPEHANE
jgi:myo-inositol-1(or 4)-monophosphatase